MNKYRLLFIEDVSHFDMKWKRYPKRELEKGYPKNRRLFNWLEIQDLKRKKHPKKENS